jgi:hypothetical protein
LLRDDVHPVNPRLCALIAEGPLDYVREFHDDLEASRRTLLNATTSNLLDPPAAGPPAAGLLTAGLLTAGLRRIKSACPALVEWADESITPASPIYQPARK